MRKYFKKKKKNCSDFRNLIMKNPFKNKRFEETSKSRGVSVT